MTGDQNLLLGILALQMDFLTRDALIAGMNAWLLEKHKSLEEILGDQGQLTPTQMRILRELVDEHVRAHQGDVHQSLAALPASSELKAQLRDLADEELRASLISLGASRPAVQDSTTDFNGPGGVRYRILRPHAKGGLGEVFVAEDKELHRHVALKEIQEDHADNAQSRGRFVLEAEITGGLEHPGIVPVYGLGAYPDGRPFYAMRFIRGDNLKKAIAQFHAAALDPRSPNEAPLEAGTVSSRQNRSNTIANSFDSLAFRALLRRFLDVCNAVAYAHSRGVLHRDLKPGNIMLGQYGETLLVDWGLAKVLGQANGVSSSPSEYEPPLRPSSGSSAEPTQKGAAIGTPVFMSPEQAAGRLDQLGPATDVYSLGATLYCILTGQAPVQGKNVAEVLSRVTAGEVAWNQLGAVAASAQRVPAPLQAICRKAMALRPEDRYAGALELAHDVEHWLADEPVSALRDPLSVKVRRWGRRHRPLVATAAAVLVVASVALAATSLLVWRERQATEAAKDQVVREWNRAEGEKRRAQENFVMARSIAVDLGKQIAQIETGRINNRPADQGRRSALEAALAEFGRFQALAPEDPTLLIQTATLHRFAANLARTTNDAKAAESSYQASLRIWDGVVKLQPSNARHRGLVAETLWDYAALQRRSGQLGAAGELLDRAIALAETLPEEGSGTSRRRRTLGTALMERAEVDYGRGEFASAEKRARRAVELLDGLREAPDAEKYPSDPLLPVIAENVLGMTQQATDHNEQAVATLTGALQRLLGQQAGPGSSNVVFWTARIQLERARATLHKPEGRAQAGQDLAAAIVGLERLLSEQPSSPLYREWLPVAYLTRGDLHAAENKLDSAAQDLNRSREMLEQLTSQYINVPAYRGWLGFTCMSLARQASSANDAKGAAEWQRKAKTVLTATQKKDPENIHYQKALQALELLSKAKGSN